MLSTTVSEFRRVHIECNQSLWLNQRSYASHTINFTPTILHHNYMLVAELLNSFTKLHSVHRISSSKALKGNLLARALSSI